jgi:hypothetical protein
MFEKVEVNGAAAHPIFRYLKDELPGVLGGRIKWNFTKFLVGRDGKPLKRFAPMTTPEKMEGNCCGTGKVSVFVARAIRLLGIADILMSALCQMRTSRRMLF